MTPGIGLEHCTSDSNLIKKGTLRKREIALVARGDCGFDDLSQHEGITVLITPARARASSERIVDGVGKDVNGITIHPQVLVVAGERIRPNLLRVEEVKTAAHVKKIVDADLCARIAVPVPFGNRCGRVDLDIPSTDQNANERADDTLPFRPTNLRRVFGPTGRVPFADDLTPIHYNERTCVVVLLGHGPVEGCVESPPVYFGERCDRARVAGWPRLGSRVGKFRRYADRLEMNGSFSP